MNKTEFVEELRKRTGASKKDMDAFLKAFQEATIDILKQGDSIAITGFGTFSVSKRRERVGRNPQTGKKITIPAKDVPNFKFSPSVKREFA